MTTADLPITPEGKIYHLNIRPTDLAPSILLVGDPDRVTAITNEHFKSIEVDVCHRGLRTRTGIVQDTGQRVSVVTSGMGTPSLEIVLQELVTLNEIDFDQMERKENIEPLTIIRVGTSGGLQESTELGTLIIASYAIGMDNTGLFYDLPVEDDCCLGIEETVASVLSKRVAPDARFRGGIRPYVTKASVPVVKALQDAAAKEGSTFKTGITVSNSGFFANQGRNVARIQPTVPEIDEMFSELKFSHGNLLCENMEMESSFLFGFCSANGYRAGTICPAIANRRLNTFAENYQEAVQSATLVALRALAALERSPN